MDNSEDQSVSRRSSSYRRRSSSRRSASRSDDDNEEETSPSQPDLLHRLTSSGIDVESYVKTVVYLYSLVGECGSSSDESTHKTCVRTCLASSSTILTCINNCDSANSNACETFAQQCSGVFQAQNFILTNHHCVREDIGSYTEDSKHHYNIAGTAVSNNSGQSTTIQAIKWYDTRDDIALVELTGSLSHAKIPSFGSVSDLHLLDELFTIGNPNDIKWTASLGHLTNKNPPADLCRNCITYSIPIGKGNSGGPVFDMHGKLVALIASSLRDYDNLNFGPHIDRIKHLINRNASNDVTALANRDSDFLSQIDDLDDKIETVVTELWEQ